MASMAARIQSKSDISACTTPSCCHVADVAGIPLIGKSVSTCGPLRGCGRRSASFVVPLAVLPCRISLQISTKSSNEGFVLDREKAGHGDSHDMSTRGPFSSNFNDLVSRP
jgi:hypothetical protein